jgi:hypothetical protein
VHSASSATAAGKSQSNLNNIGVRSFILSGAPVISKAYGLVRFCLALFWLTDRFVVCGPARYPHIGNRRGQV